MWEIEIGDSLEILEGRVRAIIAYANTANYTDSSVILAMLGAEKITPEEGKE